MQGISRHMVFMASPDKPKPEDYQKGLKVGPSSTEVPRKKKPGEPAESLVDTRHPLPMTPDMERYLRFHPKKFHPVRKMLDKDKRLNDSDKDAIEEKVSARHMDFGKDGKKLGDIVREEVEKYLAKGAPKTTLQIDAEAGVRILELHFDNMFAYRFEEVNPESKQATEAEVLAAIEAIPKARLGELSLSWVTIKSLMGSIADYTIYPKVRKAIEEKLKN